MNIFPREFCQRFWDRVDIKQDHKECWCWKGSKNTKGYGLVKSAGRSYLTHRIAFMFRHGRIPEGMLICHTCDNKVCCNPAHLFLGTYKDNAIDASRKGRLRQKLTEADVEGIIKEYIYLHKTLAEIASKYSVSIVCISKIVNGKIWKHVSARLLGSIS